jgi:hypothetical protein
MKVNGVVRGTKVIKFPKEMSSSSMSMSMSIKESCLKSVSSMYKDAMREAVKSCSEQYGFSMEEALMRLGVDSVTISLKKSEGKKKVTFVKPSFALPFTTCNPAFCNGLKPSHGLYTQCSGSPVDGNSYCKGCMKQCEKNGTDKPDNGTIEDRIKSDFKGPKGDAPKHYTAVMKKLKLTKEQVLEEASKFGIEIAEEHFTAPEGKTKRGRPSKKEKSDDESASSEPKKRGRPKKAPKDVKPEETEDLFANLVSNVVVEVEEEDETSSLSGSETSNKAKKSKKSKLTDAEKAAAKEAKDAEKASAKEAKDAEKAAAKEAKDAEKAAAKEAKEAEKEALKKEKEAKKASLEKEKADKKAALEAKKSVPEAKAKPEAPAVLKVKKFDYKGTKYLKSGNGVVYNMEQDEVGVWNDETKEIEFKEAEEEEEEEDYESEDE